jgi:hypothetical protein
MYLGYITQNIRISDIDQPDKFTIKLKGDAKILNEVVVLDEYNQAVHLEESPGALVFNPKAVSSIPSLGEQDVVRTMQLLPGITATDESSAGMVIRGSHPSYTLTMLDGMTIYQQDHFFGAFSIINSDIIKDIRVHRGLFDAKYGGRVSGVVDITSKNGNAVKPAFNIKLNMINIKATAEIPLGKRWTLFAAGRRSFTDIAQTNLFNSLFDIARTSNDQVQLFRFEGFREQSDPAYYYFDNNIKLTFRPTTRDNISLSFYVSRDEMKINDSTSFGDNVDRFYFYQDENMRMGNNGISLRWGRQWNEKYYSNLRVSNSKFFRRYDSNLTSDQYIEMDSLHSVWLFGYDNNISDFSYSADNEWLLSPMMSLEFGLNGSRQATEANIGYQYTISGTPLPEDLFEELANTAKAQSWLNSLYGSLNFDLTKKLSATAGGRLLHYYNQEGVVRFEPRITARYKLNERTNLKAGYGRSNQFVTQLFYFTPPENNPTGAISALSENFWILSDPTDSRYPVISSHQVTIGATVKRSQTVYDAELYYKVNTGVIIDEDLNSGTNDVYGIDMMVQKTTGIHTGWIAYSISKGVQSHPYINGGQSSPSLQDQRHEVKLVDMLKLGNWNLASTVIYGSGKPYPEYAVRYQYNEDGFIESYDLLPDYGNKSRLPAYFRIDLSASYKFYFGENDALELGLSIHNLTDHTNIKTRKIDKAPLDATIGTETELPPTYIDVSLLGFSPSLFLSFTF